MAYCTDIQAAPTKDDPPMTKPATTGNWLMRGLCGRCPACGEGRLFRAFVKVADRCEARPSTITAPMIFLLTS
jgi:uncharacterized protein (DUF983 family)